MVLPLLALFLSPSANGNWFQCRKALGTLESHPLGDLPVNFQPVVETNRLIIGYQGEKIGTTRTRINPDNPGTLTVRLKSDPSVSVGEVGLWIRSKGIQIYEGGDTHQITVANIPKFPRNGEGYDMEASWGVIRYAFEELKVNRFEHVVLPDSAQDVELHRRMGFRPVPGATNRWELLGSGYRALENRLKDPAEREAFFSPTLSD